MNMRRNLLLAGMLLCSTGVMLTSCDNDDFKDVDGKSPEINLEADVFHIEPGMNFNIKGTITDADGIKAITLTCPELYLNKTIDILAIYGEPKTSYDLDYTFQSERHGDGENFTVTVAVTDMGDRVTEALVSANIDADYTAPYFSAKPGDEITVLIKKETKIKINLEIGDNRVVDYATINLVKVVNGKEQPVEGFPLRIEGGEKTLVYKNAIPVPNEPATYKAYIMACDREVQDPPHVIETTSTIKVMELPNFDEIYLADVATAAELNSDMFGVPMVMDHIGDYKYRVIYYNEKAGTEVCFLGQKTDFGPICFAPSKDNPAELGDDPDDVNKIKLDKAGMYYEFTVDTYNRTMSTRTYSPAEAIDPVMHLHYGQDDLNTWWETNNLGDIWWQEFYFGPGDGPRNITHMEQDLKNPHIYHCYDMAFAGGDETNFMIHNWHHDGWWNFVTWRSESKVEPSKFVFYGNYHPETPHYESNMDYFKWKYIDIDPAEYAYMYPKAGAFDISKWSDENYRKNFIGDNWVKTPVTKSGKYTFTIDLHAERGWMTLQK